MAPLVLDGGIVEVFEQFKYLGSLVEASSGAVEVSYRIAQASRTFGSQHDSGFTVSDLTMETNQEDGVPIHSVGSIAVWC